MKKALAALLVVSSLGLSAQDLPAPSPASTVMQRVGLTDFTVVYSRPGVKGREIFGDLVAFDKVWRTGANKATAITFNTPVKFGETKVPAGTYSIFTIPGKESWKVMLNSELELYGSGDYDEANDVLQMEVSPTMVSMTETFTIDFQNIMDGKANLVIRWADMQIAIPVEVDVQSKAISNIDEAINSAKEGDLWRVYRNAAAYYSRNDIDQEQAMEYINKAIELNPESWYSYLLKGEVLYNSGKAKEAVMAAKKAMEMGVAEAEAKGGKFSYTEMVEEAIESWSTPK